MFKIKKAVQIILIFVFLGAFTFFFLQSPASGKSIYQTTTNSISSELTYDSSLYTGVDDETINKNKGKLTENDQLVTTSENGLYSLYFYQKCCIFKVKNNVTNMVYESALEEVPEEYSNTTYYAGFLASTFSITYYQYIASKEEYNINTNQAWMMTATKYTKKEKDEMGLDKYNFKINPAESSSYSSSKIANGIKVNVGFANAVKTSTDKTYSLGISFNAYVTLDNDGLHVSIPDDEIVESSQNYLLAGINVMPLLGATFNNETSGYMVIPDGSGSLIRYGSVLQTEASQITIPYFGQNDGQVIQGSTSSYDYLADSKCLNAPVFGYVNGINQDGLYGILEKGCYFASLTISPCGAYNMKASFLMPTFNKRYTYYLYGVNNTMIDSRNNEDILLTYHLLSNDDANYVGMARDYQTYLVENGSLKDTASTTFKTDLEFLMSECVESIFGYKNQTMTSLKEVKQILNELQEGGLSNYDVVIKGWNKDGYSGSTPYTLAYNTSLASKNAFRKFNDSMQELNHTVYYYNDYVTAYSRGDYSSSKDVAKSNLKLRLTFSNPTNPLFKTYSYLYPSSTKKLAEKNLKKYDKLAISGLAMDSIGSILFTYYQDGENHTRSDAVQYYQDTASKLSEQMSLALYSPNSYLWSYLSSYLGMSMYATNYSIYSDNVPFIPYVLKGYMDYYCDYLNFNALGEDAYLRMLDYGCLPSYLLTSEISYNLKYTNSVDYFTTAIKDFKDSILKVENTYKTAYLATANSVVVARKVITPGLVCVTYQNKVDHHYTSIYINYNTQEMNTGSYLVPAKSFLVKEGRYGN